MGARSGAEGKNKEEERTKWGLRTRKVWGGDWESGVYNNSGKGWDWGHFSLSAGEVRFAGHLAINWSVEEFSI